MTLSFTTRGPGPVEKKAKKGGVMKVYDPTDGGKSDITGTVRRSGGLRQELSTTAMGAGPRRAPRKKKY